MFHTRITAIVPAGVPIGGLRSAIADVASAQDLDVTVRPIVPMGTAADA